ncbi:hypothetical protein G6F62_003109 [Rhizopus arrhizus]|nr:hypothetical protein G6F33_001780 [Rhizopus arrhizus]KAG0947163.1 hypothetical protein G6F32_006283 [Rhizopus arrhizus]KAG1350967.1 hypothetical protein G6F62_003109 [Rhizopus arrhizus]
MSIDDTISQNELLSEQLQIVLEQEYKRLSLFHQLESEFKKYCDGTYTLDQYRSNISQPLLDEFQQVFIKIEKAQQELNDPVTESSVKYMQQNEKERLERMIDLQNYKISEKEQGDRASKEKIEACEKE